MKKYFILLSIFLLISIVFSFTDTTYYIDTKLLANEEQQVFELPIGNCSIVDLWYYSDVICNDCYSNLEIECRNQWIYQPNQLYRQFYIVTLGVRNTKIINPMFDRIQTTGAIPLGEAIIREDNDSIYHFKGFLSPDVNIVYDRFLTGKSVDSPVFSICKYDWVHPLYWYDPILYLRLKNISGVDCDRAFHLRLKVRK